MLENICVTKVGATFYIHANILKEKKKEKKEEENQES